MNSVIRSLLFAIRQLSPAQYVVSVQGVVRIVYRHRALLWELSKRDIKDRYSGAALGQLWAVIHPVCTLALYIFIFAFVFNVSPDISGAGRPPLAVHDSAVYILSGVLAWLSFQDVLGRGPYAIINETNMVKQVVFPIEVIPLKCLFSAVLPQIIGTIVLMAYIFVKYRALGFTILLLPYIFFLQVLAMAGISLFLSSLTPFLRDLKEAVQLLSMLAMYSAPIFYTTTMLPTWARPVVYANPVTHMIVCYQDVFCNGSVANPYSWIFFTIFSFLSFCFGCKAFFKLKYFFGNVL